MPPLNVHHSYTADVLSTDSAKLLLEIDIILVCNNKDQETKFLSVCPSVCLSVRPENQTLFRWRNLGILMSTAVPLEDAFSLQFPIKVVNNDSLCFRKHFFFHSLQASVHIRQSSPFHYCRLQYNVLFVYLSCYFLQTSSRRGK